MSQENVKLIEHMLGQAQQNPAALYEVIDDEAHWEVGELDVPDATSTYRGPAGVREFFRQWVGAFDDWGYEVAEVIDAGDSVVVHIHQWGRGKGSGVAVDQWFWQVWTLRDRKVIRGRHYSAKPDALEAVGLSE